ncbi:MAG: tetratricopeptide repeat protein [Pseudomonadota bacterium]
MTLTTTAVAALLVASAQAPLAAADSPTNESIELASEQLVEGRSAHAITSLERSVEAAPEDPALLINLGIAHAQNGDVETARAMFERALVSPDPVELETADGDAIDSRRLARKAIRMLEAGEFTTRLSRRD